MRRIVLAAVIIILISASVVFYSLYNMYYPVFAGMREYSPGRVHAALVREYPNIDSVLSSSPSVEWFLNYLYYVVLLDVPYSTVRASDPVVFLERGGDCFDFAFFIIGAYYLNVRFEDGRVEGHVAPVLRAGEEYCIVDVPMRVFLCAGSLDSLYDEYSGALRGEGVVVEKHIIIRVPRSFS